MDPFHKKQIIRRIKPDHPRLSFYRMTKNRDFDELCRLYTEGIGQMSHEQFFSLALQLERSFQPSPNEGSCLNDAPGGAQHECFH